MSAAPFVAGLWMLYTTFVHAVVGGRRVAEPLLAANLGAFPRATLLVVWHGLTWLFLTLAVAMIGASFHAPLRLLVPFAALQISGIAVVFVVVARRALGAAIRLPQWLLLGPLAIVAASSVATRPGAVACAVLLAAVALVHLAWAVGVSWPARDRAELGLHVFGSPKLPGPFACAVVAAVLSVFALAFVVDPRMPAGYAVRLVVLLVFALRGFAGPFIDRFRPAVRGSPFAIYNRFMYSPLCLLVAALTATSLR